MQKQLCRLFVNGHFPEGRADAWSQEVRINQELPSVNSVTNSSYTSSDLSTDVIKVTPYKRRCLTNAVTVPLTVTTVNIRDEKGLPHAPVPMMPSERDPWVEKVPLTQTKSINTDKCSRGCIPVYHLHPVTV